MGQEGYIFKNAVLNDCKVTACLKAEPSIRDASADRLTINTLRVESAVSPNCAFLRVRLA